MSLRKTFGYLLTHILTYTMEQCPSWEANRSSASQEISCILWNLKVHYRINKCPPPFPTLSQLDLVHAPTSHFLKIHLNIILPSKPESSKWSFPQVPHKKPYITSPPYVLHYPPISFSIWSPEQYWVSNLKECHPRCVYQNYSRSMIREMAVKTQLYL